MREKSGRRPSDTLDYLQSILGQLRQMAERDGHKMLAYLIEMAYLEATSVTRDDQRSSLGKKQGDAPA